MATRDELKALAELRLREATALFNAQLYDGCVYLCGYVVELALKARICTLLGVTDYPHSEIPQTFKTHKFEHLKLLAGLHQDFNAGNAKLLANWSVATSWEPEWRYRPVGSADKGGAQQVLDALQHDPDGVFTWLRQRW